MKINSSLYLFISLWIWHHRSADSAGHFQSGHGSLLVVSFGVALLQSGIIRKTDRDRIIFVHQPASSTSRPSQRLFAGTESFAVLSP